MKNYRVRHIRSSVVENNLPKLPTPAQLEFGEIAINYAAGYETLSIKNTSGDVVTFSPGYKVDDLRAEVVRSERVISASLNDLNDRVTDIEEGGNVQELSGSVITLSGTVDELESAFTEFVANVEETEESISYSLNDLNARILEIGSGATHEELEILSGNVITLARATKLELENISATIDDNEEVTAAALNDLDARVLTINSGITELSGGITTEIANAIASAATSSDTLNTKISTEVANAIASAATSAETLNNMIKEDEEVIAAAIDKLEKRLESRAATSASTLNDIIKEDEQVIAVEFVNVNKSIDNLINIIKDDEEITSNALTDLNTRISEIVNELTSIKSRLSQLENS